MDTITLTHRDRPVALAAPTRFWLAAHIEALPAGHPRKRHVAFMALYARDVLTGAMPGPYSDDDAERFARLALSEREDGRGAHARAGGRGRALRCAPPSRTSAHRRGEHPAS